jgi:hypothetical protein
MSDAQRYQKELDTILQELEAKERLREQQRVKDRYEAVNAIAPIVNEMGKARNWTKEQCLAKIEQLVDDTLATENQTDL